MYPVAVKLGDASVKIRYANLCAEQPQRPRRNYVGADIAAQQRINGESTFRRKETHQKPDQADQVEVIQVPRLFQQEKVCEGQKKDRRGKAVKEPQHHAGSGHTEDKKVNVHPASGPRLNPTEPVVSKIDNRFNKVTADPIVGIVAINFPKHDAAEDDAEENEERDIDWFEEVGAHAAQESRSFAAAGDINGRSDGRILRGNCLHSVTVAEKNSD